MVSSMNGIVTINFGRCRSGYRCTGQVLPTPCFGLKSGMQERPNKQRRPSTCLGMQTAELAGIQRALKFHRMVLKRSRTDLAGSKNNTKEILQGYINCLEADKLSHTIDRAAQRGVSSGIGLCKVQRSREAKVEVDLSCAVVKINIRLAALDPRNESDARSTQVLLVHLTIYLSTPANLTQSRRSNR